MYPKILKLLDFYRYPRKNGIFFSMSKVPEFANLFNSLDMLEDNDFHSMDFDYIFNRSGLKTPSVMIEQIMYGYVVDMDGEYVITPEGKRVTWDYVLLQIDQDIIDTIIRVKFLKKWQGLADTLNIDYDPLNPFSMKIEENIDNNLSSNETNKNSRGTSYNSGSNGNNNTTDNIENTTGSANQIFGFNSEDGVYSDSVDGKAISNRTNGNTYEDNFDSTEDSNYNSEGSYKRDNTIVRNTTRTGNIGNLSAQQLLEQQRQLLKYQIFETIYNDLDSVLTRSKYNF